MVIRSLAALKKFLKNKEIEIEKKNYCGFLIDDISDVSRFFRKQDEPLFFSTVTSAENLFRTVIISGNLFLTVITSSNVFWTVASSESVFPTVIISMNVFPTVRSSGNLFIYLHYFKLIQSNLVKSNLLKLTPSPLYIVTNHKSSNSIKYI